MAGKYLGAFVINAGLKAFTLNINEAFVKSVDSYLIG
jgi:hypothetical protein